MATPAEMLTKIDTAIAAILDGMASGQAIVEWNDGPLRVRNTSPELLLAQLKNLRTEYASLTLDVDRAPTVMVPRRPWA